MLARSARGSRCAGIARPASERGKGGGRCASRWRLTAATREHPHRRPGFQTKRRQTSNGRSSMTVTYRIAIAPQLLPPTTFVAFDAAARHLNFIRGCVGAEWDARRHQTGGAPSRTRSGERPWERGPCSVCGGGRRDAESTKHCHRGNRRVAVTRRSECQEVVGLRRAMARSALESAPRAHPLIDVPRWTGRTYLRSTTSFLLQRAERTSEQITPHSAGTAIRLKATAHYRRDRRVPGILLRSASDPERLQ